MPRPLYDEINKLDKSLRARFFMPSHAGVGEGILSSSNFDMTEIEGLGNLLNESGVIAQAEQLMASAYACKHSLILTQGATCANHIAIGVASLYGKKLLTFGEMHKSISCGSQLFDVELQPVLALSYVQSAFKNGKDIAGIVVTTPNYFGQVVDLTDVRRLCDKYGKLLIVDSAHGAHFAFSTLLPQSASSIADLTSVSLHKTMNVYGGGALLNVNNSNLYEQVLYYRNILHSTSPNYLTMASMDSSREDFEKNGEKYYSQIYASIQEFALTLQEKLGDKVQLAPSDDFSRLVIDLKGNDGYFALSQLLRCGIGLEMAYFDKLVAIVNPFNFKQLPLLADALQTISYQKLTLDIPTWHGKKAKRLRKKVAFVDIDNCIGKISANDIGIYPPGTPIIFRGDILDDKAVKIIKDCKEKIFGLVNGRVSVLL